MNFARITETAKKYDRSLIVLGIALLILLWPTLSELAILIVNWFPTVNTCLFGMSSQSCIYNPANGSVNFSMGEALAGIGLFFAIIQLAEPSRKIALKLNTRLSLMSIALLIIGLISILLSAIMPQIPSHYKIISTPLAWEILGYLCFIAAPIIYYRATTKINKLFRPNEKSAKRFYYVLLDAIANGKPEYAEAAMNIFMANASEIFQAAKRLAPYDDRFHDSQEIPENLSYIKYANDLIAIILSEPRIARMLATQRVDYLFNILELIREQHLTSGAVLTGTEKIFEELFENQNSHLYTQLERGGLTLYAPLYDFLFGDEYLFFVGQLNVLNSWNRYGANDDIKFSEKYVKVYLEGLETAIRQYGFKNDHTVREINNALKKLREYAESVSRLDDPYIKGKVSKNSSILMSIEHFFGHTFPALYNDALQTGTVVDYELNATIDRHGTDGSLTGVYAISVAKLFEAYGMQDKDDDMKRIHLMTLTDALLPLFDDGNNEYTNMRSRFFEKIWEKIKQNVENGYYPVVLRYYLQIIGFESPAQPEWRKEERNKLFDYMKKELVPRLVNGEHMANGDLKEERLLPGTIKFNKKRKRFFHIDETNPIPWRIR